MSLLNPAILYGLGLVAVPVVLHFLLRSKPKKFLFPALSLVTVRRKTNVRRMRLRHIWLMLLRMAVIALLVFALARPSLPAADYSLATGEILWLAAILLAALGTYLGVLAWWRRNRLPNHVLAYRRTMLRGGTGMATALLLLLLVGLPYRQRVLASVNNPQQTVSEGIPVAAVFLFDASLSMEYRQENQSRLDRAREIATAHLSNLPDGSRVAVGETSGSDVFPFQADLLSARNRVEAIEVRPVSRPLNDRLRAAVEVQYRDRRQTLELQRDVPEDAQRDRYVREIYLLTDLARSAWNLASESFRRELENYPWVQLYVIDVGVTDPTNYALTIPELPQQTLSSGGLLRVKSLLQSAGGEAAPQTVELYLQNESGKRIKQGQRSVSVEPGAAVEIDFAVPVPSGGIRQGEISLVSGDPLAHDNVRYFTVAVKPPPRVLLIAPTPRESRYLQQALAPASHVLEEQARYDCRYLPADRLAGDDPADEEFLSQFDVVSLVNVSKVSETAWRALAGFVDDGGGLAVFLGMPNRRGNEFAAVSYQGETAADLLPGEPLADLTFPEPQTLDIRGGLNHPLLKKFAEMNRTADLTSVQIRRYWKVEPDESVSIPAAFTGPGRSPAILEQGYGRGRTVMVATAFDWKEDWRENWNDFPVSWTYVALADRLMQFLSRRIEGKFNFTAGEDVRLALEHDESVTRYLLRKPGFEQIPGENPPNAPILSITEADQIGHYRVVEAESEGESPLTTGFSVNSSERESEFTRLTEADLDRLLGKDRYELARDIENLTRTVTRGRVGREVFSFVLGIMILVFCGEHFVANRFYDAEQSPEQPA